MVQLLDELKAAHVALTGEVVLADKAFEPAAKAALSENRSPVQRDVADILRVSSRIFALLAGFLETGETLYEQSRGKPEQRAALKNALQVLEPQQSEEERRIPPAPQEWYEAQDGVPQDLKDAHWAVLHQIHPCRVKKNTALGKIPGIYGISVAIDNHLTQQRILKSYVWRETHELWVWYTYHGGMTASGGLSTRLQELDRYFNARVEAARKQRSIGHRLANLFRRTDRSHSSSQRDKDLEELKRLASKALWLAEASEPELLEAAIESWCSVLDGFLKGMREGKVSSSHERILESVVEESPDCRRAEVVERLKRLSETCATEDLRRCIAARLK